jgi:hypothetical protein
MHTPLATLEKSASPLAKQSHGQFQLTELEKTQDPPPYEKTREDRFRSRCTQVRSLLPQVFLAGLERAAARNATEQHTPSLILP